MKQKGHLCNKTQVQLGESSETSLDFSVKPVSLSHSHYALSKTDENKPISVLELG